MPKPLPVCGKGLAVAQPTQRVGRCRKRFYDPAYIVKRRTEVPLEVGAKSGGPAAVGRQKQFVVLAARHGRLDPLRRRDTADLDLGTKPRGAQNMS